MNSAASMTRSPGSSERRASPRIFPCATGARAAPDNSICGPAPRAPPTSSASTRSRRGCIALPARRRPRALTGCLRFGSLRRQKNEARQGGSGAMIKSELVLKLSEQNPHLYQRDIENIVNAILDTITDALSRGDRVELRGFGAFSIKKREARTGRNPRTGEAVSVSEKVIPVFKTGKEMRIRLNETDVAPPARRVAGLGN